MSIYTPYDHEMCCEYQGWKKCETSLEYSQKLHQKCEFFTNFQKCLEEKYQNIYLNGKSHFKIANISLQKHIFPGMRLPNSTFFSLHACLVGERIQNKIPVLSVPHHSSVVSCT